MWFWDSPGWRSGTLFLVLAAVSVASFLAIRFGRVAARRHAPIVVKRLIDPALILPLVLIAVVLTPLIFLLALFISVKRLP